MLIWFILSYNITYSFGIKIAVDLFKLFFIREYMNNIIYNMSVKNVYNPGTDKT